MNIFRRRTTQPTPTILSTTSTSTSSHSSLTTQSDIHAKKSPSSMNPTNPHDAASISFIDETTSLLSHPPPPPSLPTTISSLDDAFIPTLPVDARAAAGAGTIPNSQESTDAVVMPGGGGFKSLSRKTQWLTLAIASGACAAFNGVFAKLTTTTSTSTLLQHLLSHLPPPLNTPPTPEVLKALDLALRTAFFLLNLAFNGLMWTLFTRALARGNSTTQVAIVNTSANFLVTALLGAVVFGEAVNGLWGVGAACLVVGGYFVGRGKGGGDDDDDDEGGDGNGGDRGDGRGDYTAVVGGESQGSSSLGDGMMSSVDLDLRADEERLKRSLELGESDILDLGDEETPHPSQAGSAGSR